MTRSQALAAVVEAARKYMFWYYQPRREGVALALVDAAVELREALAAYDAAPDEDVRKVARDIANQCCEHPIRSEFAERADETCYNLADTIAAALLAACARQREEDARLVETHEIQYPKAGGAVAVKSRYPADMTRQAYAAAIRGAKP